MLQDCKKDKAKLWIHYKPSLFQHIGTHSSLKGKVQKLKVSFFIIFFTLVEDVIINRESKWLHLVHLGI